MSDNKSLHMINIIVRVKELLEAGNVNKARKILKALTGQFPEDMDIAALLGAALFHSNQFINAEALLHGVLKKSPLNKVAWGYYYRSLRRQGKLIDCVRINRSGKAVFPADSYFYGEPFAALGLTGNVNKLMDIRSEYRASDKKGLSWIAAAHQAKGNHVAVLEMMEKEASTVSQDTMLQQLMLRSLGYIEKNVYDAYKRFSRTVENTKYKTWVCFELARYMDITSNNDIIDGQSERAFNIDPTPYCPKITGLSEVEIDKDSSHALADFNIPKIDMEGLRKSVSELITVISTLHKGGVFDRHIANIDAVRKRHAADARDPVQMLSTGRCGTVSFYKLLCRSKNVLPYHTLGWQLVPSDRNHMLYRIITQTYDQEVLIRIFNDYLENRVAEMMYAYRQGRTPVIINHWDTIFSPLWSVIFSESRFLHVFRSDEKVFESLYAKNQFQNEQLHYCQFAGSFPEGKFFLRYDDKSIEEEIAWYLYITREFSNAFIDVLADGRAASLASENIFKAGREEYDLLRDMLPLNDLTYKNYCEHYNFPINTKLEKKQTPASLDESKERFLSSIEALNRNGEFLK